jgi:hypothetical protein
VSDFKANPDSAKVDLIRGKHHFSLRRQMPVQIEDERREPAAC